MITTRPQRLADPTHPHVIAALGVKCPACNARPGHPCGWWRGKPPVWRPLATGLVHHIRIPETALFGGTA